MKTNQLRFVPGHQAGRIHYSLASSIFENCRSRIDCQLARDLTLLCATISGSRWHSQQQMLEVVGMRPGCETCTTDRFPLIEYRLAKVACNSTFQGCTHCNKKSKYKHYRDVS
jgi:hypothetical protein